MKFHIIKISVVFLFLIISLLPREALSQAGDQGLRVGLKLPYTYDIGYYQRFSPRIGMYVSTQFVTVPMSNSVTGLMNLYGSDPKITAILDEGFAFGYGFDHGWQYYFGTDNRRYYGGLSVQWMSLLKQEIKDEVVDNAYANDPDNAIKSLDEYPVNTAQQFQDSKALTMNTSYLNIALTFGITFKIPNNKNSEFRLESQLAKNIASRHYLYSDYRYISPLTERVNSDLQDIMMKYGWFPSINFFYIYKL